MLSGMLAFVYLASFPTKVHRRLSDSSFFIYTFHGVAVLLLSKALVRFVHPQGTAAWLSCYGACFALTVAVSIFFYALLNTYFPRFTAFVTGGRSILTKRHPHT